MFKPKFAFTISTINHLSTIERLYGLLLGEKLIPSLALKLAQENKIRATHHSNSIEGNPLSQKDVTNIILNDKIPVVKSEVEIKNYFSVLNTIFILARKKDKITTELTQQFHHQLMEGVMNKDFGQFRNGPVFVGHASSLEVVVKHNPPYHAREEITKALTELYGWLDDDSDMLHPLLKAAILHHQFAYYHPFFDGNGRLARILTSYYLLLKEYEVVRYFILDDYYDIDRKLYSDKLHSADSGEETEWVEYFLEGVSYSLQAALARINQMKRTNLEEVAGEKRVLVTPREEQVLQIVIDKKAIKMSDIEDNFSVTRQQAHALLFSLVKKGLLQKFGSTKASFYKLAKPQ